MVLAVALVAALDGAAGFLPAAAAPLAPAAPPSGTVGLASPADTFETPGQTDRVSFETDGSQLPTMSITPGISADGRFVVYRTALVSQSGDVGRIMLRDRLAGTTTEVARGILTVGTADAIVAVSSPTISRDGRWVAYVIGNPDPAAGNRTIALWDRTTGTITRPLARIGGWADQPSLSGDGRYLAFRAMVVPSTLKSAGNTNVWVMDLGSGSTDRASVGTGDKGGLRGDSGQPSISSDGRYVAFTSNAYALVAGPVPTGQTTEVYLRDRTLRRTGIVSAQTDGTAGSASSSTPSISASGQDVAFTSLASLVDGDTNGVADVYLWSSSRGGVTRVSVTSEGAQASGSSLQPSISGDGTLVAFASTAADLVPNDTNGAGGASITNVARTPDVFVHTVASGRTSRISIGPGPVQADGSSLSPSTDGDGGVVAFSSNATNLVLDDSNRVSDVFVRVRPAGIAISPDPTDFGTVAAGGAPAPRTVTVSSTGLMALSIAGVSIGGTAASSFGLLADGCTGRVLAPGESCQLSIGVSASVPGLLSASVVVDDNAPAAPHSAGLTALVLGGPGLTPKITLTPPVGPTGTVVVVVGSGFAAGQPVTFKWSKGITPTQLDPVTAAPDGSFTTQVLVLPNDLLGPRKLSAASVVAGKPGTPATAPFLVVEHTAQPPTSTLVRIAIAGFERPIIWRR